MSIRNSRGQGLIEYVILVAIIAVGTIIMVRKLQSTVSTNMANIVEGLQSNEGKRKHSHIRVEESDYKMKDFSNFMNGTTDRSDSR